MPAPAPAPPLARLVDQALEASVVGSFSRIGYLARARLTPFQPFGPADLLRGRVAVVTGGTSGIGFATARALVKLGAEVVITGRDDRRNEAAVAALRAERSAEAGHTGAGQVTAIACDLTEVPEAKRLAAELKDRYSSIEILVHNAGAMFNTFSTNRAGIERTVALHTLSPFALTASLLGGLEAATSHASARVVHVSSGGMYAVALDVEQLEATGPEDYRGARAYARAKRAQVALAAEWARRLDAAGPPRSAISVFSMHPGWADTPGVTASLPRFASVMRPILRTADEGADTIIYLATADGLHSSSGGFFLDRRARSTDLLPWTRRGLDEAAAIWDYCVQRATIDPLLPASPQR